MSPTISAAAIQRAVVAFDRLAEEIDDVNGMGVTALEPGSITRTYAKDARNELEALLHSPERALAPKRQAKRKPKSKARRDETAAIRAAVFERAGGFCESVEPEACAGPSELDHQWGRGKAPQSVENCRALCSRCHLAKTKNLPSARYWLEDFERHAKGYGYHAEAERARARLEGMVAIRERETERRST